MTETTDDDEALEGRTWNRLAAAVTVTVLCLLGIVVVQLVRRFLDSIARSHVEPGQLDEPTGGPLHLGAEGWRCINRDPSDSQLIVRGARRSRTEEVALYEA